MHRPSHYFAAILAVVLMATSCSLAAETTTVNPATALIEAISNDVLFQPDTVTREPTKATCIGQETVAAIGLGRLTAAGVTVTAPNPLAGDLNPTEIELVLQAYERCTGTRPSASNAQNATGAEENIAAPPAAAPAAFATGSEEADSTAASETESAAGDASTVDDAPVDPNEGDGISVDDFVVTDETDADSDDQPSDNETAVSSDEGTEEAAEVEPADEAEEASSADLGPGADEDAPNEVDPTLRQQLIDDQLRTIADTRAEATCAADYLIATLGLSGSSLQNFIGRSDVTVAERHAIVDAAVACTDIRASFANVLLQLGNPPDRANCLASALDVSAIGEILKNLKEFIENSDPYLGDAGTRCA